jgi:peptidoglycan/xylan/chitin deacetylase (PgdA/CDA1 family)
MADRHLFFGQRSLSLVVVAVALSVLSGCTLPAARSASPRSLMRDTNSIQDEKSNLEASKETLLVAKTNQAYKKVIAKLVQQERIRRLNTPIPTQFQGKTFKQIKLNSNYKTVAQGASAKPTEQGVTVKPIALTFDDGPWPHTTGQVLDILKKNNVKATFFVVGRQVQTYPQLLKRIVADGHALGNHTWSHQYHRYDSAGAAREIDRTTQLVYKLTGIETVLFRPPGGILNNGLAAYAQQKKYAVVMWSADSLDWRYGSPSTLTNRVLKETSAGGIVLMHDGGGNRAKTVQALPQLIAQLKKRGYTFVTVQELMEMQNKEQELMARKG